MYLFFVYRLDGKKFKKMYTKVICAVPFRKSYIHVCVYIKRTRVDNIRRDALRWRRQRQQHSAYVVRQKIKCSLSVVGG